MKRLVTLGSLALMIVLLGSCFRSPTPIRIGFVGGLTGKTSDLGISGRNGAILAIERQNAKGGIQGRPLELLVRDDGQDPEMAKRAITDLIGQNVRAIIGPMTSAMALAMAPLLQTTDIVLMSPTVTTIELSGKDDSFFRVIATTREYAKKSAQFHLKRKKTRAAVIHDSDNRSYSENWFNDFKSEFETHGGKVIQAQTFASSKPGSFEKMAADLLKANPDLVLIIANSFDAAMLCQQIRKKDPRNSSGVDIAMAEWASTERFIDLAGSAGEGVYLSHFGNRNDKSERFTQFWESYKERFRQEPGYPGVAAYDAAWVLIQALAVKREDESLKETLIRKKVFEGLQEKIEIDAKGDTRSRATYVGRMQGGKFVQSE